MSLNYIDKQWSAMCPPAAFFPVIMTSVILFDLYRGTYRYAISHTVVALLGTLFLWVLCAAKMEFVAYALYFIPILFLVFFMAVLVYDRAANAVTDCYRNGACNSSPAPTCCGKTEQQTSWVVT